MKDKNSCHSHPISLDLCDTRCLGCEFSCDLGNGEVSDQILAEEEKFLGKGYRKVLVDLINEGWEPLGGKEFFGYLKKDGEILAPDYNGGFYSRRK